MKIPDFGKHSILFAFAVTSTICATTTQASAIISELQPNPIGNDSTTQTIELSGTPSTSFSGVFLSIENDRDRNIGIIERLSNINGIFDGNGLLSIDIDDLENPSFTVVLLDSFSGTQAVTDIDTDNDGIPDDLSTFGNVIDAIGVPDISTDEAILYGDQLGGTNLTFIGSEPSLIFRDASVGQLFVVDNVATNVFDANANSIAVTDFNTDPTVTTFGAINPSLSSASVPFEFSPALGLLSVGGMFGISRLRKTKKINVK